MKADQNPLETVTNLQSKILFLMDFDLLLYPAFAFSIAAYSVLGWVSLPVILIAVLIASWFLNNYPGWISGKQMPNCHTQW